jgi:hypothetical protein
MRFHANGVDAFLRALALRQFLDAVDDAFLLEVDRDRPTALAIDRRSGTRSMQMTCFAPSRTALRIAIWPTGPAPHIATVSVGFRSH